jgi:hypothetical protein
MFNTNAEFTKIRRQQGFDEFLKILLSMDECIDEIEVFLEIDKGLLLTDNKNNQEKNAFIKPQISKTIIEKPTNQLITSQKSTETTPVRSVNSSNFNQISPPLSPPSEVLQIPNNTNNSTATTTPLLDKSTSSSQSIAPSISPIISIPISTTSSNTTNINTTENNNNNNNNNELQNFNEKIISQQVHSVKQKIDEKNDSTNEAIINKSSSNISIESIQSQQINQIIIDKIKTQIPKIIPTSLLFTISIYILSYFGNIIDLTNSSNFGIFMSIMTLTISLILIRISLLKRNLTLENETNKKNI